MLKIKTWTWTLASWTATTFVLCVIWGLATPESLHMHQFLEMVLPHFHWISFGAFLLGLGESFLYGVYAGLLFVPLHNFFHRLLEHRG